MAAHCAAKAAPAHPPSPPPSVSPPPPPHKSMPARPSEPTSSCEPTPVLPATPRPVPTQQASSCSQTSFSSQASSSICTSTCPSSQINASSLYAHPCDPEGNFLPPGTPPPPLTDKTTHDWTPYKSWVEFKLADYLFTRNQTPAHSIDHLCDIWAASLMQAGSKATLFSDHRNVYKTVDNTPLGDVRWQSFTIKYTGEIPEEGATLWMADSHEVWFRDPHEVVRNMLANPDFAAEMDLRPVPGRTLCPGDWAYNQADMISEDADTHGSTFVPVILGSDKTTVSDATGQNDYYPLYASIGNVQNNVCCAHQNAVAVIGFLAMPKTTKQHAETDGSFRRFHLPANLRPAMTKPEVVCFRDGHYRRVIYGLGPYIADYEEQVVLACIVRRWCAKCLSRRKNLNETSLPRSRLHVDTLIEECNFDTLRVQYGIVSVLVPFMNDFPHANIHELLAPDLLHQIIKGAFKDHLVEWVEKYLIRVHRKTQANIILDDIDRQIAAVPPFPGLRRFPQGCHFKQWTGDDSKALMKVYLPAIEGYVPEDVVRTFSAFLKFCYLVRHNMPLPVFTGIVKFSRLPEPFLTFSLPQQHSMSHYIHLIRSFGAPNSLCSSIMESKHIKAVKEPWRRSSQYNALGQMLLINQHLDKLAASHMDFRTPWNALRHLLVICSQQHSYYQTEGKKHAQTIPALADELIIPDLADLVQDFLIKQLYPELDPCTSPKNIMDCPRYEGQIRVYNSTVSTFFALSDLSGIGGMKHEYIRVSPNWRQGYARKDCVFIITDPNAHRMLGMDVARVLTFFSFRLRDRYYPCAVVRWFNRVDDTPDNETGLWMVEPSSIENCAHFAVIHIESIFRSAHLIPVYGTEPLPSVIKFHHTLDIFTLFYVNKYTDHHAFEITS
ncbi:uncharacterized protein EDB91DRAFT_1238421 [Suillus paluster]|uniref:uncharacterized protein n=1 Tax=Suillus paluster TaxID=48578 RepID=UPI001B8653EB|nr:uncharacterized protein EDB91DRAFT_1238421 [Suillus paluster]KAG1734391.1 hypothetical protein EDB91DRAFT_1238421 [Suillus paluster]